MSTKDQISQLENRIAELEQENLLFQEKVDILIRKLFGRTTEKTSSLGIEGQMSLFDEAEVSADTEAPEPDMRDVASYRRKKFRGQREALLKDIPHVKKLCTLAEEDRFCEACGSTLYSSGEEFVRTEIEFIPAKIRVIHQKFELAVPLYRQEKEWKVLGVALSRATMSNWLLVSYRDWLAPVVDRLKQELVRQKYLHIDETVVQVLNESNRKNTTDSYMWVYCSIKDSKQPVRLFDYKPGKSGEFPKRFLGDYKGYVHTDAYKEYEKVNGITRCLCWTHLRRYFLEALLKDMESPESTIPAQAIAYINKLFEIENKLEVLSPEGRKEQRLEQEIPVLNAFWSWAEKASKGILPKSKLGMAFQYALGNKEGLLNYLLDGNCVISNNLAENSIRPFTIGRKNWLFSGSPKGAEASAGIYTLIETAKANGLNPTKYIQYILSDIPGTAFLEYPEILNDYMPWDEYVQKICR